MKRKSKYAFRERQRELRDFETIVDVLTVVIVVVVFALNRRLRMSEYRSNSCLYIIFNACAMKFNDVASLTILMIH